MMNAEQLKAGLTRKIGPLPLWAWGGVVVGGVLIARAMGATGGGIGSALSPEYPTAPGGDMGGGSGEGATGSGESVGSGAGTSGEGGGGDAGAGFAAGGSAGQSAGFVSQPETDLTQIPVANPADVFAPIYPAPSVAAPVGPGATVAPVTRQPSTFVGDTAPAAAPVSQAPSSGTVTVAPFVSTSPIKHAPGKGPTVTEHDVESAKKGSAGGVLGKAAADALAKANADRQRAQEAAEKKAEQEAKAKKAREAAAAKAKADAAKKAAADAQKKKAQQAVGKGALQ